MKIAIFGLGYVGCTAAGCLASQGHDVVGVDVSEAKVATINAGCSPVKEPGLDELISAAVTQQRLRAVREIGCELDDCDIAIVCVGTPSGSDGAHNMSFIAQVSRSIADALRPDRTTPLTLAYRSTMRPGSTEQIILPIFRARFRERTEQVVELVYNPEFLREASAIEDFFAPPKIVVGTRDGQPAEKMQRLYGDIDAPMFVTGMREAEITKFVDNTWHATKVAFANEIGRVCQNLDISAAQVHEIFAADTKLNMSSAYTRPGNGFGGSCLPKDVRALQHMAAKIGAKTHLVDALLRSNEAHKHHQFVKVTEGLRPGARVLLVGLAFKAGTDDLRESPAVDMARKLLDAGFELAVYDPSLRPERLVGQNLGYAFAHLPTIECLLVDREAAESGDYDLVLATNRLVDELNPSSTNIVDISSIP